MRRLAVLPSDAEDLPLRTIDEVMAALARATNLVLKGGIDPKVANSAAYLLAKMLRGLQASDHEQRMLAIEEVLRLRGKT
jgi:hypothetical protein